jgi:DNA-binding MarR family transcriptional regulator
MADSQRRVVDALRSIVQALRTASSRVQQQLGVSGAQLFVLQQLVDEDAASLNDLAERTMTHQSSASVVVSRLEEKGLIKRERSSEDARKTTIALTAKGRKLVATAPMMPQAQLMRVVRTMPSAELDALAKGLQRILSGMGLDGMPPALFFEDDDAT